MHRAGRQSCGTKDSVMHTIKTLGKSGQISLGKAMAGMGFIMQELPGGDIVLKRAVVVPMNERLLDPVVHAELEAAREWRRNNPAKATEPNSKLRKSEQRRCGAVRPERARV